MTRRGQEAGEDDVLWAQILKTVTPLKNRKAGPAPVPVQHRKTALRPSPQKTALSAAPRPGPRRPARSPAPVERVRDRRVRTGRVSLDGRVDLHGLGHDRAQELLLQHLHRQHMRGARTILVITGRGAGDQGVLRTSLVRWLNGSMFRTLVWGYAQAHPRHGGRGAWYVFLRRPTR